jgi:thioredoxin 2
MASASPVIIRCADCGTRNKVPQDRVDLKAKCGRCGAALDVRERGNGPEEFYTFRCPQCKTRNRIPAERRKATAKCGKCTTPLDVDELFKPQPMMVTDKNFVNSVLESPIPVLVFCWAPWCPTCGAVAPIIDEFARESKGKIRVAKLNVDANPNFASKYNVLSVPYLFIFDNGQLKDSGPGGLPKHELMMKMAYYM